MLMFDGVLGFVMIGLWIFCIIDTITTPADKVRNLPKIAWLLIVILLAVPGAIVWLVAGRPWPSTQSGAGRSGSRLQSGGGAQSGGRMQFGGPATRSVKRSRPTNPDDDEEFLASLQARADEQRRRAREMQAGEEDQPGEPTS
ncbi:MAG: PLD nuclease N-terminal domain-containing protein [Jatrophihabitantaceae bacterium]